MSLEKFLGLEKPMLVGQKICVGFDIPFSGAVICWDLIFFCLQCNQELASILSSWLMDISLNTRSDEPLDGEGREMGSEGIVDGSDWISDISLGEPISSDKPD